MGIKFSYKGVFLLLFVVICSNLLFTPFLRMLDVSQMHSIWIVTSISASMMLTIVVSFIDGTYSSKVQLIVRFVFFLVGCTLLTHMIVF
ncbi:MULTISPECIES: hypothetical protein [Bacillus cereus group]|uniref:Uncharacterized protein n=1 Tax=Bacillus cereus TaxID=1396 RepID=A0AA44TE89_BACCE|nr:MULTISPECIES: hypothetical protein [Bacillus cereus group]PFA22610.1 hypothetical protein CN373_08390 [Bacillus cereus]PFN08774.1 hypothetical protein COJ55_05475 [Bacillus cereus]PFO79922.1 hypothetical protein COJ77_20125 [Bacillus cereus]PFR24680.1 hypothetical protein COK19_17615 [Bacillus cereus]PFR99821.1 hypothetical protein COK38_14730 [Bacillus cereus]